ncbi:hypothetical protein T265_09560 [Opisthorchis viverrini]|uniref:ERCC1-like central domain-containing protein n=1 Tax=Opisthorchis viverrini TaxID=6198 RepID=A0A075A4H8_OPIVI|nr:hypothetical protein T265_09560 [Opisthorchis viverrini]KER22314.1 hypothetical protein T265_09560 [Opisthorchis viverrini]
MSSDEPSNSGQTRDTSRHPDVDDSFEENASNFRLFDAYREGNLDCDVISTQKVSRVLETKNSVPLKEPLGQCATDVPRSWRLAPEANKPTNASVSLGSLCKTKSMPKVPTVGQETSTVSREPYAPPEPKAKGSHLKPSPGNAILVNQRQRGNPLLKHIHNVAWEYAEIEPDYVVGRNNCVYFLSLRYHKLNPEYIFERVRQTKQNYQLSVLLCQVDITDPHYPLKELCKLCLSEKLTLMLAWSPEEAARYLEAYKALENKPPDDLMPAVAAVTDHRAQITEFLTAVRPVTKADAVSAINNFKTVADMINADAASLESCPGFGQRKAQKLYEVFRMPFLRDST